MESVTDAESYGIGIPITFVVYAVSAWLKKNGDGNMAFGILWGGTMLHTYEAAHGFAVASKGATAKPSSPAVQRFGLVLRF